MACRNIELAEQSMKELQKKCTTPHLHIEQLDITDKNSIDSFIKVINEKYKTIDVLINNAGVARKGDAFDEEVAEWTFATVKVC
jgi:carbonyl reductase 1